jgi:hypothetical protein
VTKAFKNGSKNQVEIGNVGRLEIIANREGLMELAAACPQLAMQPENDEKVKQTGNHTHFAEEFNNLEPGSDEFIITYKPDL